MCNGSGNKMNPKLWVALEGGRVVVFDASTWSMLQDCIQVGKSELVRKQCSTVTVKIHNLMMVKLHCG